MLPSTKVYFEWVAIPSGDFLIGHELLEEEFPYPDETPSLRLDMAEFRISRSPITNAQYADFVQSTNHTAPGHWIDGLIPTGKENLPVTYVDFYDAQTFCDWAGVRLPTEADWEKAARGTDGRLWPWGNQPPDARLCNFNNNVGDLTPVGQYVEGASPYGVLDMAGNIWEWTSSLYQRYPYQSEDGRENEISEGMRALRGGSYVHSSRDVRCAARQAMYPSARDLYIGFRVVSTSRVPVPSTNVSPFHVGSRGNFDWLTIPAGEFVMGSNPQTSYSPMLANGGQQVLENRVQSRRLSGRPCDFSIATPLHRLYLPDYWIAKVPVTNLQYQAFVEATGYPVPGHWEGRRIPPGKENHPVTYVDWNDACAFCNWAGVSLPTEAEWEKAARGTDARRFPWGNRPPDSDLLTYNQKSDKVSTSPVGQFPLGASPYGVLDMAGNVWEWTSSLYREYPYVKHDGLENPLSQDQRVMRGGSFQSNSERQVRCSARSMSYPVRRRDHLGFRVMKAGP